MPPIPQLFLSLLTLSASINAKPDEVVFKNGEKLIGKITRILDGKIIIESDTLGTIKAPLDKVSTFSTDDVIDIVLADGSIVKRKVAASEDGMILTTEEGVPGEQKLAIAQIKKVNPEAVRWTGALSVGATFSRGNSDTDNTSVTFEAQRRTDDDRITVVGWYASTRTKDQATLDWTTSQARFGGKLQYDYFFAKSHYAFATARGEKDRIAGFDLRFIGGVGLGQQWIEESDVNFSTEEGLTWTVEDYNTGQDSASYAGGMLAYHLKGNIREGLTGFNNLIYNQGFEDGEDRFFEGDIGLRAAMSKAMFAEVKVLFRYDNTPAVGKDKEDVLYIVGIGWSF